MKVSDYVCQYLVDHGIDTIFCVSGDAITPLVTSIKQRSPEMTIYFNYGEMGCSMAAEAYQRVSGKIPVVLTNMGPGATSAITGVVGAWQESVPYLVISGQCNASEQASATERTVLPVQPIVATLTKYTESVRDAHRVAHVLDTAMYRMREGRPGPVWIDLSLDVQTMEIEPLDLPRGPPPYVPSAFTEPQWFEQILAKLRTSTKPILYIGHGVRGANAIAELNQLAKLLNIPIAATWTAIDMLDAENKPLYVGNPGIMGEVAPNVAVQTADFMLSIGTRLSIPNIGYNYKDYAPVSWKAMVDIDPAELMKPTIQIDLRIACDCKVFLSAFIAVLQCEVVHKDAAWIEHLRALEREKPTIKPEFAAHDGRIIPYFFVDQLSKAISDDTCIVTGSSGSASRACTRPSARNGATCESSPPPGLVRWASACPA
jgi:acetolactate synthase-1/2/3 large subunit